MKMQPLRLQSRCVVDVAARMLHRLTALGGPFVHIIDDEQCRLPDKSGRQQRLKQNKFWPCAPHTKRYFCETTQPPHRMPSHRSHWLVARCRAGGAGMFAGAWRVTFWGALAMAITAGAGASSGAVV